MLTIESLAKSYGGAEGGGRRGLLRRRPASEEPERVFAVDGVSFDVRDGELFTLLGPSGCGKTTTLRCIAGLERPDSGRIAVDGRVLFSAAPERVTSLTKYPLGYDINVSANKRGLGMVFQSYAIWPHMTVFRNVSFPLDVMPRGRRPERAQLREQVMRVLEVTELATFADRPATKLSGGQQQRLALARALVIQPELMLLDEPLSNLDAKLRETMRFELKRLQLELGLTTVYVTHDQSEALAMSSRIAVMNAGKLEQIGKPREIYTRPQTQFVAEFIGTSNFIPGKVAGTAGDTLRIDTAEGTLWGLPSTTLTRGGDVLLALRPENLKISTEPGAGEVRNEWRGSVLTRAFMGDSVDHVIGVGKFELRVRCNPSVSIPPGTEVYVTVDPANVAVVPAS
jgi:iron(III) transport system ATP-binding protein